jgi:hypothetical protein
MLIYLSKVRAESVLNLKLRPFTPAKDFRSAAGKGVQAKSLLNKSRARGFKQVPANSRKQKSSCPHTRG